MFENIVIPLDGSQLAEESLALASRIETATDAHLHIVRVVGNEYTPVEPMTMYGTHMPTQYTMRTDNVERAGSYLQDMTRALSRSGAWVTPHLRFGDPAAEILAVVEEINADLVMMTTHGRTGLSRWALGSVTERVLRHATCPVLALRNAARFEQIVIALDGSEFAERAVEPALELARLFDCRVTLLRVKDTYDSVDHETWDAVQRIESLERTLGLSYLEGLAEEAERYVRDMVDQFDEEALAVRGVTVRGAAPRKIIDFAASQGESTLIAMTTHGRAGLQRWVYGSVTEKVLRAYNGPMLIVRPE